MKLIALVLFACLFFAPSAEALPPAPPSLAELVRDSDLIAVVKIGRPSEKEITKGTEKVRNQRAKATVKQAIKGTAPETIEIVYQAVSKGIACRPPDLARGTFLLFLKKDKTAFVRTNYWYSQAPIVQGQVKWVFDTPTDLAGVTAEIKKITNTR